MAEGGGYPRNVRQIGEPERSCLIYLEDYADAYIRRIPADGPQGVHAGVLYGRKRMRDGFPCYYLLGAAETSPVWEEGRLRFGQSAWKRIEQMRRTFFASMEICGWFVRAQEEFMPEIGQLQKVQDVFFAESGGLVFIESGGEGKFYCMGQTRLYPLRGYYIFYQENAAMRDFLAERKAVKERESKPEEALEKISEEAPGKMSEETTEVNIMKEQPFGMTETLPERQLQKAKEQEALQPETLRQEMSFEAEKGSVWRRRLAAAVLFVLLAAGVVLYREPERAKALQQMLAQRMFGTEEALPASGNTP